MTDARTDAVDTAEHLLAILPRLLHALRRDRTRLAGSDPLAEILSERRGQFRLLHVLLEHERLTTQELAQRLDVAPPTVSTMVHALAEHDLITRERDGLDHRQVWISLSERGRGAVAHEHGRMRQIVLARLEQLGPEDQQTIAAAVPALERLLQTSPPAWHQTEE